MGLAYGNEVQDFILDHSPCREARAWLRAGEFQTLAEAWDACPRGYWMMWALRKTGKVDHKTLILLACDFADHVLSFYENKFVGDLRPRTAIEAVRKYTSGDITLTELRKAKYAAYAAAAAAAAGAAYAAAAAAAAAGAARVAERKWQAGRIRELVGNPY